METSQAVWLLAMGSPHLHHRESFEIGRAVASFFSTSADPAGESVTGIVDAPQLVGLGLVIAGGLVLANWRTVAPAATQWSTRNWNA